MPASLLWTVFGFCFLSISDFEFRAQQIFSKTILKTIFVSMLMFLCHFFFDRFVSKGLFTVFFIISIHSLKYFLNRPKTFSDEDLLVTIDYLILKMKMGSGLKSSLRELAQKSTSNVHQLVANELLKTIESSDSVSKNSANKGIYFRELAKIESEKVQSIERMTSMRRNLKIEILFRQKSRQVSSPAKIQSFLMSILYLGLLIYQIQQKTQAPSYLFVFSGGLFGAGILGLNWIGRRQKWKT